MDVKREYRVQLSIAQVIGAAMWASVSAVGVGVFSDRLHCLLLSSGTADAGAEEQVLPLCLTVGIYAIAWLAAVALLSAGCAAARWGIVTVDMMGLSVTGLRGTIRRIEWSAVQELRLVRLGRRLEVVGGEPRQVVRLPRNVERQDSLVADIRDHAALRYTVWETMRTRYVRSE